MRVGGRRRFQTQVALQGLWGRSSKVVISRVCSRIRENLDLIIDRPNSHEFGYRLDSSVFSTLEALGLWGSFGRSNQSMTEFQSGLFEIRRSGLTRSPTADGDAVNRPFTAQRESNVRKFFGKLGDSHAEDARLAIGTGPGFVILGDNQ